MKLFRCRACGQVLYFENTACERCGHRLGFLPAAMELAALEPEGEDWRALGREGRWRFCDNAGHQACNWLVPTAGAARFCESCGLNRVVPDLAEPANLPPWRLWEAAKHRLTYALLRLRLPLEGLRFDILAGDAVMTGHDEGLITLALAEADDAERERRRTQLHEPYRTLLGHVRHEVGHFYWNRLVRDAGRLGQCRAVFGDDRADYAAALQAHYANGPPAEWQAAFVSAYASAHPWEDFAETWAHTLHLVDTLEMAAAFGLSIDPAVDRRDEMTAALDLDPYRAGGIEELVAAWLPLSFALNALARCLGQRDPYPFILSPAVIAKLGFVHSLIRRGVPDAGSGRASAGPAPG